MVRQGTLTPSLAGSSPAIPAKVYPEGRTGMIGCLPSCENKPSAPLAQSVEHLPFKQGVRGSNPRRGTKKALKLNGFKAFLFLLISYLLVTASTSVCASMCVYMFAVQKPGPQAAFDQNREGETAQGFPLTRPFPCLIGKRFPLTPQSWAFRMVLLFLASGGFETSSGFARPNGTSKPDAIFHPPTGAASPNFSVGKIGAPVV